jgi:hypothetical protein
MRILLKSDFLQFNLLSPKDFVKYLCDRGIKIDLEDLEYYDRKEVIRPALRLRNPEKYLKDPINGFLSRDSFSMHYYHIHGLIDLPQEDDFKPWQIYNEKAIELYYHQYQFVPIRQLLVGNNVILKPDFFEKDQDYRQSFDRMREYTEASMNSTKVTSKKWWPKVGLLMLLQEAYSFHSFGSLISNPQTDSNTFFENWRIWRLTKFDPEDVRKIGNLPMEEIKELYIVLCHLGHSSDPLFHWFVLLQIINDAKKKRLTKKALLAQEYYNLARMVQSFIYDLTKEKMPDPDDSMNGAGGKWKPKKYGTPFDYNSKQTRNRILYDYLATEPYRIALIYEGDTEDYVIKSIFDALYVDQDRDGIFLHNAEGQGNIQQYVNSFAPLAKANEIDIFIILDREARWKKIIDGFKQRRYLQDNMYHVWKKDFESDNFDTGLMINTINKILKEKGQKEVKQEEVNTRLSNSSTGLMKIISDAIWEENKIRFSDVVSKVELAKKLIDSRIIEIRTERHSGGWKPVLPIEQLLYKIFRTVPKVIG